MVPEPATIMTLALGLIALMARVRVIGRIPGGIATLYTDAR